MNRVLRLRHHLRVEPAGEERAFLLGGPEPILLRGRLFVEVARLVDGRRTVAEIVARLAGQGSAADVYYALGSLEKEGHVVEDAAELEPAHATYWEALGLDARRAAERLSATPVKVRAVGGEDAASLASALVEAGVSVREDAALEIVATDDYLAPDLQVFGRSALTDERPWMLVKPSGGVIWIGPIFQPGAGPCWACLAARLRENRPVEAFLERHREGHSPGPPPRMALRAAVLAGESLAALTLARWIAADGKGALTERLVTLDPTSLQTTEHVVVKRPECPTCGDPDVLSRRARAPFTLSSRPKRFTDDGAHRIATPEETWTRWSHHVSPLTGVVSLVGPVAGRDHPLRPVYRAVAPVCPQDDAPLAGDFRRTSWGKGRTPAEARTGALCEALERRSAVFQGDEPRTRARLDELGDEALAPEALLGFSDAQYRARVDGGAVPLRFDARVPIDWTPVWSLTQDRRRLAPTAHCYTRTPSPPEARFFVDDSNGHAAGNCLEEAIVHGFLELVERDAIALWWYSRAPRPSVLLPSFGEPWFVELEASYRAFGHPLRVLDLTSDLGIPAFVALAGPPGEPRLSLGFGCHFEARLAVQRALTELNQTFVPDRPLPEAWRRVPIETHAFLFPDPSAPAREPQDFPYAPRADLADDVRACVALAANAGLETLVLDQTRPDLGVPVVKVLVPGLRHFRPRLAPGRLYDVPVRLGWLPAKLAEAELNPLPVFF